MLLKLIRQVAAQYGVRQAATVAEVRSLIERGEVDLAASAAERLVERDADEDLEVLCLRGDIAFRQHNDELAESFYRRALTKAPGLPEAHYGLSLVMQARGEQGPALRHAQFAVNNGKAARLSAQLGLCHLELNNFSRANEALRRATRLDPTDKASWNNLGISLRALDDLEGARSAFARALEIDPAFESAQANARLLDSERAQRQDSADMGAAPMDLAKAIESQEMLVQAFPDAEGHVLELSRLYLQHGDARSGIDVLRAYRARFPDNLNVISELGRALVKQHEFQEAKPLVERALKLLPEDVPLLLAMADIRVQLGRLSEAGEYVERAAAIDSDIHMKGRLAASLAARCRYQEALDLIEQMEAERPSVARDTLPIKIDALTSLGRHDEALPVLDEAIRINPSDPHRRFLRASINLLRENFEQGWEDYSFRNLASTDHMRMLPFALWRGEPLKGKTILVAAEQGLGDQVMFASCLPDLLAMEPGRVIVEAVKRVAPTLARSFPTCEVIATLQDAKLEWVRDLGHVDYFVMLGDLPRHFRTRRSDFPEHCGYFVPDPTSVARWTATLNQLDGGEKPRIGFSWRGGTEMTRTGMRSLNICELSPIFAAIPATWICLQYGDVAHDLATLSPHFPVSHWPEAIKNLDEFAALVSCLDLVVTVCNTTVHYAGATGKPVWVLAPKVPEWRYGLSSTVLPWYPSSRVMRQTEAGRWSDVTAQVAAELGKWEAGLRASSSL